MEHTEINAAVGKLADIGFVTRGGGGGPTSDGGEIVTGVLNGDVDTWGKFTVVTVHGESLYLFADEITGIAVLSLKEVTDYAMRKAVA